MNSFPATERAGKMQITFPPGQSRAFLIKATESANVKNPGRAKDDTEVQVRADATVVGRVESGGFCDSSDNYTLYFVIAFQRKANTWCQTDELHPGANSAKGHGAGGYVTFPAGNEPIFIKAGISFVSVANTEANLRAEIDR